jgi:predicted  nucleic acid-binding Zn-ribbon protein
MKQTRVIWLLTLLALPAAAVRSQDTPAAQMKASREALAKWVETQQIIAKEKKDWQTGREMLSSRISLVKGEIADVEEKMKDTTSAGAESVQKKSDIAHEEATLKEAAAVVAARTAGLEKDIKALMPRLPEPIKAKVEPLVARMPADPEHTQISVAERLQNVVGILNEVGKFNGEITLATEVRTLADGKPSEVRTIYVGLAQAYYVSASGEAGVGRPSDNGWTWESKKDLAKEVQHAVEILQTKAKPAFVPLPVAIR